MIKNFIFVNIKNNNIDKCFDKYERFNYVIVFLFVLNNVGLMELKVSVLFKFVKNIKKMISKNYWYLIIKLYFVWSFFFLFDWFCLKYKCFC